MILKNGLVVDGNFSLRKCDLRIEDGIIAEIAETITGEDTADMSGHYILPGFIDSHMHGAMGCKISDTDPLPDFNKITAYEATQGVTGIAISTVCSDFDHLLRQISLAAEAAGNTSGAKIAAIHAEGPFINPAKKGAMNEEYILLPDRAKLDRMIECGKGLLKLTTLAPEMEGSEDLIAYAVSRGLTVSMGHTNATYEQAVAAIRAGATQTTHTFNAMRGYSHREPGVLGAALTDPAVCCEMICDHTHLHPAVLQLMYRAKGPDKINIISDSEHGAGIDASEIIVDGEVRYIRNGVMMLADGTIAGSASSMLYGIQNLLRDGFPLTDISRMASLNPARTLKIDHLTGSIAIGKAADLAILDTDYQVKYTYIDGKCVYSKGE
ncbi:MAG: N-acetylglucosamine-6-phosphate deacetylase [Clostridiales bacterium]|nr:N-acetylglucosamine-6-phosphate deacetylase [Clostridiales bacterium]